MWSLLKETVYRWSRNDGNLLASAMAYYAALSFFPLLLVLISGLGFALRFSASAERAQDQLIDMLSRNTAPALAQQVRGILAEVKSSAGFSGPVGLFTLLLGAVGIFAQLDAAFDRIWQVSSHDTSIWGAIRGILGQRLKAFALLLGLGLLVLLTFFTGMLLTALRQSTVGLPISDVDWRFAQTMLGVALNAMAFCLLYEILPRAPVRWRDALVGGVAVALVWEIGRQGLAYFIVRGNYTAYGVVGSFIAIMLWVYYASILLFLGAQLVQVLGNRAGVKRPSVLSATP